MNGVDSWRDVPLVAAPPAAETSLNGAQSEAFRRACQFAAAGSAALLVAVLVSWAASWKVAVVAWALGGAGLLIGFAYGLTAKRALEVRAVLTRGCIPVLTVGWTRSPDGCNIAVFPSTGDPSVTEPSFVVRLATIKPTTITHALLAGETRRGKPIAILAADGVALAVGRVRSSSRSKRVWARRNTKTPWWSVSSGRDAPPSV